VKCQSAQNAMSSSRWFATRVLVSMVLSAGVWGCGDAKTQERMKLQLAETKSSDAPVAKFSGKVTIDGEVPSVPARHALVLILFSDKDTQPGHETIYHTACDKDGHFEFTRYSKGDGVPPGSYTVLFEELVARTGSRFTGEDQLKNLYNDPDKSPFHVDISPPGKTDWMFNLEIAGKDPATPGPHAVKQLHR
jgi:hypothetical protein